MSGDRWVLRRAVAGDGSRLQALRLRALETDGSAFLETLDAAATVDAPGWEARITRSTRPGRQVLVVVEDGDEQWVAMAGAFIDAERDSPEFGLPDPPVAAGHRWAMMWGTYVEPAYRGRGIADALCTALHRWAWHEAWVQWLGLSVRDTNTAAVALYRR